MSDTERPTGRLDPRVTAGMRLILNLASTIALGVGASFFNDLKHSIADLATATQGLKVQIAVLESNASRAALVEAKVAATDVEIAGIKERVRALEGRGPR
jgi:hypothetical protein